MKDIARTVLVVAGMIAAGLVVYGYRLSHVKAAPPPLTPSCKWIWVGPVTGWVLEADNCNGDCCDPPSYNGTVSGQEAFTPCRSCGH